MNDEIKERGKSRGVLSSIEMRELYRMKDGKRKKS